MLCLSTYQQNAAQSGLPEKLITYQPVKIFLAFHGTKMFNTVFTESRHLFPITLGSTLILFSRLHLGLQTGSSL
jgi:hypothetical protein